MSHLRRDIDKLDHLQRIEGRGTKNLNVMKYYALKELIIFS